MQYAIGFILGLLMMLLVTYAEPYNIRAVNEQLMKEGHAYYTTDGDIAWYNMKDCQCQKH